MIINKKILQFKYVLSFILVALIGTFLFFYPRKSFSEFKEEHTKNEAIQIKTLGYVNKEDNETWLEYQIIINPKEEKLNNGNSLEIKNELDNLKIDEKSILVLENKIKWKYENNTFQVPDSKKITINYAAKVISDKEKYSNRVELLNYYDEISNSNETTKSFKKSGAPDDTIDIKYEINWMDENYMPYSSWPTTVPYLQLQLKANDTVYGIIYISAEETTDILFEDLPKYESDHETEILYRVYIVDDEGNPLSNVGNFYQSFEPSSIDYSDEEYGIKAKITMHETKQYLRIEPIFKENGQNTTSNTSHIFDGVYLYYLQVDRWAEDVAITVQNGNVVKVNNEEATSAVISVLPGTANVSASEYGPIDDYTGSSSLIPRLNAIGEMDKTVEVSPGNQYYYPTVEFTYNATTLKVSNTVENETVGTNTEFNYTITGPTSLNDTAVWAYSEGEGEKYIEFTNGVANFTLIGNDEITFLGLPTGEYTIDQTENTNYTTSKTYDDDTFEEAGLHAAVSFTEAGASVSYKNKKNDNSIYTFTTNEHGRLLSFEFTVNPNELELNDGEPYTFTQTYSGPFSFQLDSFRFYDKNGLEISGEEIGIDVRGDTVTFTVPDNQAIMIQYDLFLNGTSNFDIMGNFSALGINEPYTVHFNIPGDETITTPSLYVYKFAGNDPTKALLGAVFNLYNDDTDELVTDLYGNAIELITDSSGHIDLSPYIEFDTRYCLKEVEPPPGYMKIDYDFTFSVSKNSSDWEEYIYMNGETLNIKNWPKTSTSLTVSKQVEGNMADVTKEFQFVLSGDVYQDTVTAEIGTISNESGEINYNKAETITIDKNNQNQFIFQLKHNEYIQFTDLDSGNYTITENSSGYTTSYILNEGSRSNGNEVSISLDEETNLQFFNTKSSSVPTGVITNIKFYITLLISVMIIGICFIISKRKNNKKRKDMIIYEKEII